MKMTVLGCVVLITLAGIVQLTQSHHIIYHGAIVGVGEGKIAIKTNERIKILQLHDPVVAIHVDYPQMINLTKIHSQSNLTEIKNESYTIREIEVLPKEGVYETLIHVR